MRAECRQLLEVKRDTLNSLIKDYNDFSLNLNTLRSEEARLLEVTEDYAGFIAERVLWIRSAAPLAASDAGHGVRALAWSFDPANWRAAIEAIRQTVSRQPALFGVLAAAVGGLLIVQRPARRRLNGLGEEAQKRSCTRLRPTLDAVWLSATLALPGPALLALAGWLLDSLSESDFVRSLSLGAHFAAVTLLLVGLARQLCRRGGLADAHFDWPTPCLLQVRRKLRWVAALGTPLALWLVVLEAQSVESYWTSSLGRVLFLAAMVVLSTAFHRLLLAANSPFRQIVLVSRGGWLAPLQLAWRPCIVLSPVALAGLASVGYYYTAQQAAVRLLQSAAMLLAVLVLGGVTRRWLLVSRRRLAREQAKQRRAQLAAAVDG